MQYFGRTLACYWCHLAPLGPKLNKKVPFPLSGASLFFFFVLLCFFFFFFFFSSFSFSPCPWLLGLSTLWGVYISFAAFLFRIVHIRTLLCKLLATSMLVVWTLKPRGCVLLLHGVKKSTWAKTGWFGIFFVLCFFALGGHCLQCFVYQDWDTRKHPESATLSCFSC